MLVCVCECVSETDAVGSLVSPTGHWPLAAPGPCNFNVTLGREETDGRGRRGPGGSEPRGSRRPKSTLGHAGGKLRQTRGQEMDGEGSDEGQAEQRAGLRPLGVFSQRPGGMEERRLDWPLPWPHPHPCVALTGR